MCQAYEGEKAWAIRVEQIERAEGKPDVCEFQAGYLQCKNTVMYERSLKAKGTQESKRGWICSECGTFYPRTKS